MCIRDRVLNDEIEEKRLAYAQTPGGTGAIHQLLLLLRSTGFSGAVWISDPTWPNHGAILKHLGLNIKKYSYFDEETCEVDFDKMQEAMSAPWMVEWDEKHNNTDVVYLMEEMS